MKIKCKETKGNQKKIKKNKKRRKKSKNYMKKKRNTSIDGEASKLKMLKLNNRGVNIKRMFSQWYNDIYFIFFWKMK